MKKRWYRITAIEACRVSSVVDDGVEKARDSAMAVIAERAEGTIKNGMILSGQSLSGRHSLVDIGVVVWVTEESPVAATC